MKNPFASKTDGATLVRVQIAFNCMDRGPRSVIGQLGQLADDADTSTAEGIEKLAGDAGLLLLRRSTEWLACCGTVKHFGDDDVALSAFDREILTEAAKFDRENPPRRDDETLARPTVAVVSAIACLMGDREDGVGGGRARLDSLSGDAAGVKAALQELAQAGVSEGEVFGFELLWVPEDDDDSLGMDDVLADWPELITC